MINMWLNLIENGDVSVLNAEVTIYIHLNKYIFLILFFPIFYYWPFKINIKLEYKMQFYYFLKDAAIFKIYI